MWITNIASILAIVGVSAANFFDDAHKGWIALGLLALLCGFSAWRVFEVSKHYLEKRYPKGYLPLSTASSWTTTDGKMVRHELLRHVQIKRPAMRKLEHTFHWTGSKVPAVESPTHELTPIRDLPGQEKKCFDFQFKQTRTYNDVEVIVLHANCDDSDQKAIPKLGLLVDAPVKMISFKVELLHAIKNYFGESAIVSRVATEKGSAATKEQICTVKFDHLTKSYSHTISDPEPGYNYEIVWEQPKLSNNHREKGSNTTKSYRPR